MALAKCVPGAKKTEEDVIKYLQTEGVNTGKITKWMLPVYVLFTDGIPRTSVGKFDKIAIRKRIDEYVSKAKKVRNI
jgi:acyl-CoA synthetase (AMP-forming)/AMP-acid ligase II